MLQTPLSGAKCCPLIGQSSVILAFYWLLQSGGRCRVQCLSLQTALCVIIYIKSINHSNWQLGWVKYKSQKYFLTYLHQRVCKSPSSNWTLWWGLYHQRARNRRSLNGRWWRKVMSSIEERLFSHPNIQPLWRQSAKNVGAWCLHSNIWTPLSHD